MKNTVFFDLETLRLSSDFPDEWGKNETIQLDGFPPIKTQRNIFQMQLAMAGTRDKDRVRFWNDGQELLEYLLSDSVDQIVTFNGNRFDFCVLLGEMDPPNFDSPTPYSELFMEALGILMNKSIDLLQIIEDQLGHRISLDQITSALFDDVKEIDGTQWLEYFMSEDLGQRTKAINYLLADVENLFKICGVILNFQMIAFTTNDGGTQKVHLEIPSIV